MRMKEWFIITLVASMLMIVGIPAGFGSAAGASGLEIQCVSDQHSAVQGGKVGFHILYHNVENKVMSKAWLKVKVSKGFELEDAEGADWDAASGTLKWNLKDFDSNGADVVHFNLKVKDDVPNTAAMEVSCSGGMGEQQLIANKPIRVQVATEVHQPVFNGYPDGRFHPERQLTRAETAAIVARVKELPAPASVGSYQDVPADHWAYGYVQKVTASGYMNGSGGAFRPDQPISRAEFVVLMLRVKGIEPIPLNSFSDSKGHWAKQAIGTSKALKYIDGHGKDMFIPDGYMTREEVAKLLAIMLYRGELKDGDTPVIQHWPDVPKDVWSFGWIEELSIVAHESKRVGPFSERLVRYLPEQTRPL
ncbi:hypothetical protein QFZ77_006923 [Paenibacillus sp. V4I3]|uniref:S-layer homology domain-containing protein n=1 Tax=Paenibacillus sp. V4I3 TaxID=3042305 RepID=UPI0027818F03|nr:S-layer homology domain-containing protein [Paenibacillus sp. V4I3]MDQ0878264.1 hypothetical protein [Paenibacillus sp. V4I3]